MLAAMRVLLVVVLLAGGCKKEAAAPERPVAPVAAPAAPVSAPVEAVASAAATPHEVTVPDEVAVPDGVTENEVVLARRGAFGPAGEHLLVLAQTDDGTDVEAFALVGGRVLRLGSIQRLRDQVTGVESVSFCQADSAAAREVCVAYSADPLGSTREEPYVGRCVFDWVGALKAFRRVDK